MKDHNIWLPGKPVPWQRTAGSGARRYTNPRYQAWLEEARWLMLAQHPTQLDGPVRVEMEVSSSGIRAGFSHSEFKRLGTRGA